MATTKITTPELFDFSDLNTALQLPSGNTASRPSAPSDGEWRFNTEEKYVEYYDSGTTAWYQIDTEATCTTNTVDYPTTNTAYYKLDSTALDQTTNNYDGTETNMTYCNGQEYSQGAVFNGSNSYITLPVGLGTSGDRTRSFWVKVNNLDAVTTALYIGDLTANAYYETVNIRTTGVVRYQERYDNAVGDTTLDSSSSIQTNTWNHIAYVFSGSTRTLYLNGAQVGQTTSSYSAVDNSSYGGYIGGFGGANNPPIGIVNGKMDQFRFFSSELTSAQITELYNEVQCPCTTNNNDNPTTNVAYYKLDGNANDATNTYSGTWSGTEAYAYGPYGISGVFNGSTSYISIPSSLSSTFTDEFSFSAWVYPTDNLNYNCIFSNGYGMEIYYYQGEFSLYSNDTNSGSSRNINNFATTTTSFSINRWHHVVLTFTKTSQSWYINGQAEGTNTTSSYTPYDENNPTLGYFSPTSLYYLSGRLDQVRIFSSALSATQVTSLYDEVYCNTVSTLNIFNEGTSSCLALYEFEDNANSTDSSTYNGTWSGTEAYGGGQYKKAGIFNATSSKITVPAILSSSYTGSVSFSAWFNMSNSSSNIYSIIASDDTVPVSGKVILLSVYNGVLELTAYNFATVVGTGTTNVADGEWHNVIVVFDNSAGTFNLYLDGNSTAEITFSASLGTNLTLDKVFAEDWNIGAQDTIRYFDGSIDQVRIFNKALSETERLQVYTE